MDSQNTSPHCVTSGNESSKKAVVYVHGWGCQSRDYSDVIKYLSQSGTKETTDLPFLNLIVDLPGHGRSILRKEDEHPTMQSMASLVLDTVTNKQLEDVVIVGHSMGVRVVLEAWHQSLSRSTPKVSGLVFIDGSHYQLRPSLFAFDKGDPRSASLTDEEIAAKKAEVFQSMFSARTPGDFRKSTLAHVLGMNQEFSGRLRDSMMEYDRQFVNERMVEFGRRGERHRPAATKLLNLQSSDIGPDNLRVSVRHGDEKSHRWMKYIEATVPQVKQVTITESAHFPHVDRPDLVASELRSFFMDIGFLDQ